MTRPNPYQKSLSDKFWHALWLPREKRELETAFHYAVTVNKLWRAEFLLNEEKVNIASGDNFAVRWAANGGHVDMLHLLFRHGGVDVNAKEGDALIRAVRQGHHAAAALLLEKGADIAQQECRALHLAHEKNDMSMLALLLSSGQDVRIPVRALYAAAQEEQNPQAADRARLHLYQRYLDDSGATPPPSSPPPAAQQNPASGGHPRP